MKYIFLLLTLLAINFTAQAQQPYWVIFTDKAPHNGATKLVTEQALQNRQLLGLPAVQESDIPVNSTYLDLLKKEEVAIQGTSKWLNAAFVELTPSQIISLKNQPFVAGIQPAKGKFVPAAAQLDINPADHSMGLMQIKAPVINKAKLTGKGVAIGVIDAGFYGASKNKSLAHIFDEKRVKGARDYVNPDKKDHYNNQETGLDYHGTTVLENIAGYNPDLREQMGFAVNANFYLARTDHGVKEWRGEEHYYVRALEWLDSMGVRLVNTSLGYATGFTDPAENYKPADMDGKTSVISKAVQTASDEKGMLIIVAAGNEGLKTNWKIVSAPADAAGVLSVGATAFESWTKMGYSGIGPEALPYLKPDVSCYSLSGTSFSAPVITGFAACLLEKKPDLSNKELIKILQQSGHLYPYGNNMLGYGVPQADVALQLLEGKKPAGKAQRIEAPGQSYTYKVKDKKQIAQNGGLVLFHKKNEKIVTLQETGELTKKGEVIVKRKNNAARTTLAAGLEVIEIVWK